MKNTKQYRGWFAAAAGLSMACAGFGQVPSVSELLDKYTHALDSTASFIEHYETKCEFMYNASWIRDAGTGFKRGQVRYEDRKMYVTEYNWGDFSADTKNLPEDRPYYRCHIVNHEMAYQHDKQIGDNSVGYAGRRPHSNGTGDLSRTFGTNFVTGYINSDERLDQLLRKAERILVRPKTEKVGDSECYVIAAVTDFGRFAVWLDPQHGYHPAKVQYRAGKGNYSYHHPLTKNDDFTNGHVEIFRFAQVDDIWVPVEAKAGSNGRIGDAVSKKTITINALNYFKSWP